MMLAHVIAAPDFPLSFENDDDEHACWACAGEGWRFDAADLADPEPCKFCNPEGKL
jgi:hypothetical protein